MRLFDVRTVPTAVSVLYKLLQEREFGISHKAMPTWDEHNEFFHSDPYRAWMLIDVDGRWAGSVNLTRRNEIGIAVFKPYQGKGYGGEAVARFMEIFEPLPGITSERPGHFVANINPANEASIRLFEGLGFRHVQNTYVLEND